MSVNPTPTTELEAVNEMLSAIGESPVNSLGTAATNVDVARARKLLLEVSKLVQEEGWKFNTEADYPLLRNQDNEIPFPANAVMVDADKETSVDVCQRGARLYDAKAHTFKFTKDLKVEIIFMFAFEDLPEVARQYIYIRATRKFQDTSVGSEAQHKFTQEEEARARVVLTRYEGRTGDYNILSGPVQQFITRRSQLPWYVG